MRDGRDRVTAVDALGGVVREVEHVSGDQAPARCFAGGDSGVGGLGVEEGRRLDRLDERLLARVLVLVHGEPLVHERAHASAILVLVDSDEPGAVDARGVTVRREGPGKFVAAQEHALRPEPVRDAQGRHVIFSVQERGAGPERIPAEAERARAGDQ